MSLSIIQVGGTSSQVIISAQDVGSPRVTLGASSSTPTPTPEYWWRADVAGLTTTSWPASAGGLNMTLSNVTSANSTTGILFNGTNGFGSTANLSANIDAKHTFLRIDFTKPVGLVGLYGGSQNNIHEQAYWNSAGFFWYWVENLNTAFTWAARTAVDNQSIASWADFTNGTNPRHYEDNDVTFNTATTYSGTYNNRLRWQSGFNILLGRRQEGNYSNMYVKEFAIFTTALTTAQGTAFRDDMLTRWP